MEFEPSMVFAEHLGSGDAFGVIYLEQVANQIPRRPGVADGAGEGIMVENGGAERGVLLVQEGQGCSRGSGRGSAG